MRSRGAWSGLAFWVVAAGGCGGSRAAPPSAGPPAATSSAAIAEPPDPPDPADGPVPALRTGPAAPVVEGPPVTLSVLARTVADGTELLALAVPEDFGGELSASVGTPPGGPGALAFYDRGDHGGYDAKAPRALWIRRARTAPPAAVTGELYRAASDEDGRYAGRRAHFSVSESAPKSAGGAPVRAQWLRALASYVAPAYEPTTAWGYFAASRLREMASTLEPVAAKGKAGAGRRAVVMPEAPPSFELGELMETTTGATAVQEALQKNRPLFARATGEAQTVPLESLASPHIAHHPWKEMLSRLGAVPSEPLASSTPAEFYFVRANDLTALFRLFDQVDAWVTPAASVLDGTAEEQSVATRYARQLGVERGPLTRLLGPAVVGQVALAGSDPYVREGSDVTVLLQVKNQALFDAALAETQDKLEQASGPLTHQTREHGGVAVRVARSKDGGVAQQRAQACGLEILSNSAAALDRVLDTCAGTHPKLSEEPDFQFMLARDPSVRADVLAYAGDRFVGAVVGAAQKVLESRRQIALGELMTPGFAALLYGWVQGRSPVNAQELVTAGVLHKNELAHASGEAIAWAPGEAARSPWGSVASLTPLLDLPPPARVSKSERAAYEHFAGDYQRRWSSYIDPIAARFAFDGGGKDATVTVDLRELPLIDESEYRDIAGFVGDAHFVTGDAPAGLRVVAAVGPDADLRRELEHSVHELAGYELKLDWVGQWAAIGLADRAEVASVLLHMAGGELPQRPGDDNERGFRLATLDKLPLYGEIAIQSPAQAAIAIAAVRIAANETLAGMLDWGESSRHRGVPIVRVGFKKEFARDLGADDPELFNLFYAVTPKAILVTLQDWLLRHLIDEQLDGRGPHAGPAGAPNATQFSFDLASDPGKAIRSAIAWLLEGQMLKATGERSGRTAEAILRGSPEIAGDPAAVRARALAYFGAEPRTPDGEPYVLDKDGASVRDPSRGTPYAPAWPDVPVAGSPVARVMDALRGARTELAFDDEGKDKRRPMHSLHAHAVFQIR